MFGKNDINDSTEKTVSLGTKILKEVFDWVVVIVVAVAIAYLIRHFIFTMVSVDGDSMNNTLIHGDRLCVVKLNYKPENGDIIVFNPYGDSSHPYIKRIIATEGQSIYVDSMNSAVYVDGKKLEEDYLGSDTVNGISFFVDKDGYPTNNIYDSYAVTASEDKPYIVPEGYVFAMGDNRARSHDSRAIGPVHKSDILGKAVFRWYPFNKFTVFK